jgi:oxysterol-binding protein 1
VHPQGSGTTPLHLAASLGRIDIVNLLLEQDGIDDTLRDIHGKTCREVAKSKECIRAIDGKLLWKLMTFVDELINYIYYFYVDSRSFLNATYRSLLRSYVLSPLDTPPNPALISILSSPRIRFVNLSYLDDDSGTSLLHEAAKRKDLRLIELAVRAGADVFVRDRRGRMAHEGVGKDDKVRVFLRQCEWILSLLFLFSLGGGVTDKIVGSCKS